MPDPRLLIASSSPRSVDPRAERLDPETTPRTVSKVAHVGLALAGLEDPYAAAFRFRWARELDAMPLLERHLIEYARRRAARDRWPAEVAIGAYNGSRPFPFAELVRLALLAEHRPDRLANDELVAALLGVAAHNYRRRLRDPYHALRAELDVWCSIAYRHVRRRLGGEDE